jgi:hypothetical protein
MRLLIPLLFLAAPVAAQPMPTCGPFESQSAAIQQRFHEQAIATLNSLRGLVTVLWVNRDPAKPTWTITTTDPDTGQTCLADFGMGYSLDLLSMIGDES